MNNASTLAWVGLLDYKVSSEGQITLTGNETSFMLLYERICEHARKEAETEICLDTQQLRQAASTARIQTLIEANEVIDRLLKQLTFYSTEKETAIYEARKRLTVPTSSLSLKQRQQLSIKQQASTNTFISLLALLNIKLRPTAVLTFLTQLASIYDYHKLDPELQKLISQLKVLNDFFDAKEQAEDLRAIHQSIYPDEEEDDEPAEGI